MSITDDLAAVFEGVGAQGFVHACEVDGDGQVGLDPDAPVVTASVFKVPVLVQVVRDLDLTERMVVPASRRTPGPTGLSVMLDDVELSVRDLAFMMMSVSDNTATDVLMERVGVEAIAATLTALGCHETVVAEDCDAILAGLEADLGAIDGLPADVDPSVYAKARALDPMRTNRTTPRDMTRLLSLIWRNEAAPPDACAEARRIMALQVWPHRLRAGFGDDVAVAAKTGTLPGIRNEAGVVTYGDGHRYAVAVFTRARSYAWQQPPIDAAIGTAARLAVEHLRAG